MNGMPTSPASAFVIEPPGTPSRIGWSERPAHLATAQLATQCVHAGVSPDLAYGAVMPPIYQTSTFAFRDIGATTGFDYTRSGNPTRAFLEDALALLEGGSGAAATCSGMSAILLVLNLLPAGSHILCTQDCYGGTHRTMEHARQVLGIDVTFVDFTDLEAVGRAFRANTNLVWIETPSNPLLHLADIEGISALAKAHGALSVVDNTFLSPVWQRPFELGADLVVHSTTKYLNGHSDVVGGAVVASPTQGDLAQRVKTMNNLLGVSQSPHDCFLVLRGLKTLDLRMRAHEEGARTVAHFLEQHRNVARVYYPGLASHPQHALAKKQQRGFGAMISFALHASGRVAVDHVMRTVRWFTLAESLGGVESLIAHPASMTHASMTEEARDRAGIADNILRLSVGIEGAADLVTDLDRALSTIPSR